MKLSIVLATLNRAPMLQKALASVNVSAGALLSETEIIVVDGGSTDRTELLLRGMPGVNAIYQGEALGCVPAFNAGFQAARGEYVAAFNDDAEYLGNTLELACQYLDSHPQCGQAAIPYREGNEAPHTQIMRLGSRKAGVRVLYANFSVTRRVLGEQVGWWGDYLTHYAGDCELSANIWMAGYSVDELPGCEILHHAAQDGTRRENDRGGSREFYQKWARANVAKLAHRLNPNMTTAGRVMWAMASRTAGT